MYMVLDRALAEIAKRIEGKREVTPKSVNLLGVTPFDFGPQEHVDALIQKCGRGGMEGVVDLGDGRYTGKPCSCTGGRGESGGLF